MFQPLCHREAISYAKGQRHAAEGEPYSPVVTDSEYAYRKGYEDRCLCPDDCNCRHPWRENCCGCQAH